MKIATNSFVRHALLVVVLGVCMVGCFNKSVDVEMHKRLAGELRDARLYQAAVQEYEKVLSNNGLEINIRANINYLIGKLYFENLQDYENAAAFYVRARALNPEGSFIDEASRNMVTSLEKLGRMVDARRELDASTFLDDEPRPEGDVVVARVGGKDIWLAEVEQQMQTLPPEVQKRLTNSRKEKIEFVKQYVGAELMYNAAVRQNYGDNPEVKKQMRLLEKKLLVDKYVMDNVIPKIHIDTSDVRNFYAANRDVRYGGASYDSVRARVYLDYQNEKAESAFNQYLQDLAIAEKVEILEHNIR